MDIVHKVKSDKAYVKYKALVKKWEKEFKVKHSRVPSKYDIKEAPEKVRYAYKQYFNMKSAALEESLLDCTLDEETATRSPEFPPLTDSMFDVCSPNSTSDFPIASLPTTSQIEELLTSANKTSDVNIAKKTHLNENPVLDDNDLKLNKTLSDNVSKKLFEKSKFSFRNPRKSHSFGLGTNKSIDDITQISKTDLVQNVDLQPENSLFSQTADQAKVFPINNFTENISNLENIVSFPIQMASNEFIENTSMQINLGWLERSSGTKFDLSKNQSSHPCTSAEYGISNLKSSAVSKLHADYVENSESENDDLTSQSLKPALKKRKLKDKQPIQLFENDVNLNDSARSNKLNQLNPITGNKQNDGNSKVKKCKIAEKKKVKNIDQKSLLNEDCKEPPRIEDFVSIDMEKDLIPRFDKDSLKTTSNDTNTRHHTKLTSAGEKLEQKVKNGTLNENFLKINIKKKVFVRGKKSFNYSKYKKKQWKDKQSLTYEVDIPEGGKHTCFKCGSQGHMARYCTAHRGDSLLPLEAYSVDNVPTLSEMESKIIEPQNNNKIEMLTQFACSVIPESFKELLSQTTETSHQNLDEVQPIYSEYQHADIPNEVTACLKMFGHEVFRPGQEQAIMRILSGLSTLLILSTGSGKSLCYQLPAYIYSKHYKCVTLVVSPLVSLMDDQVLSMPEFLKAGCLHTNQSVTQRQKIMQLLKDGQLNILLISPEALISGDRNSGIGSLFKSMPPIAFACIDEAHCVSQWSHNFRPSYLMICRVLREKLKVNCILGLTATASQPTITSIIGHLNVPDGMSGVITNPTLPPNLMLSVSFEKDKDRSLITLLSSEPFSCYNSIIIYCIRRDECERVAAMLRSTLQEPGKIMNEPGRKRKRMSYLAETYHAGLSAAQRRKIQNNFMNGSLKIIVATVAFGMGINKSDIRCIIHYNMPKSFESYVQEVGRAGRDGKIAHCHVFMNRNNDDKNELLKHIHANTIDRHVVRKLLQKVFVPCDCKKKFTKAGLPQNRCKGHEVAFSIDDTIEELDIASENISTLLCYLELHPKKYIQVLNNCYTMCKIYSYGGSERLLDAAKMCPPLAMAYTLAAQSNKNINTTNSLDFPVIDVASAMGWESGVVKYHLKNLEWVRENGASKRSTLKVEFHTLGLRVRAPGDLEPSEMDEMLDDLHGRVQTQEKAMIYQLEEISRAFAKIGKATIHELYTLESNILQGQSNELKDIIRKYFLREDIMDKEIELEVRPLNEERAVSDIKALISAYKDCTFNGRAVARILQGIPSPNFPAIVWGRCKFWRTHIHEDFHGLAKLATQQLIGMRY